MYFSKLLLACRHAIAQSKQRYAGGERKQGGEYTNWWGGRRWVRGGRHLWMMDERWEGLQTVRCSLYLSCLFDMEIKAKLDKGKKWGAKMAQNDWMRGGGMIRENYLEEWQNRTSFSFVRLGGALDQFLSPPPFSALVDIRFVGVLIWLVHFSGSASFSPSPHEERLSKWWLISTEQTLNMPFVSWRMVSKLKAYF